ncbi:MAG: hypothetical protein NOU37_05810 [Candidatus Brocadiales bacterium]|nr:hypothetical protein [Candidatus Bathyanammoxibius amoris]
MFTFITGNLRNIILGLILAIFAGALGSALWQSVRNPLFSHFSEPSVIITTLGSSALLDAMYQEIGRGFSQNYSISSYYSLHETVFAVFLATVLIASRIFMAKERNMTNVTADASEKTHYLEHRIRRFLYALTVMILALLVFFQICRLSDEYKNNAILHIHQSITICSPFVSANEIEKFYSEFSSIRSRDDYIKLDEKLRTISEKNDLYFPEFKVF